MKVKEREAWTAYNVGKGGKKSSFDQFNKSFKGQERNPRANEFASMDVEEYHHYSERAEYKEPTRDQQNKNSSSEQKKHSQSSSNATRNIVSRVAGTAVSAVVGAVVVVTTYQTIEEHEEAARKPIIEVVDWEWNDQKSEAEVKFYDADGNLIKASMSTITVLRNEPTCTKDGSLVYTASITEDGKEYTDTKEEVLPALSHDFDDGHVEFLEDGTMVMTYECSRCHEQFSVEISYEEE